MNRKIQDIKIHAIHVIHVVTMGKIHVIILKTHVIIDARNHIGQILEVVVIVMIQEIPREAVPAKITGTGKVNLTVNTGHLYQVRGIL